MRSFRVALALRSAGGVFLLFLAAGIASVGALRTILNLQLDATLLHLAEVEAQWGAAASGSDFKFHEGVLLAARETPTTDLTRYAQLWSSDGRPLLRSANLGSALELPAAAFHRARSGQVGWASHRWQGRAIRSVVYPLRLVGAAHGEHLLQVAAPTAAVTHTVTQFVSIMAILSLLAAAGAFAVGWRLAGAALRPTREITEQAEAVSAGTLSDRITAHADAREFSRLVTVLNSMLDRLQDAFDSQRRFTADASHELRAPLHVLRGNIEVALRRERTVAQYRETLTRCRDEVVLMSRLAADLLVLARSDAGVLVGARRTVYLRELVVRVVQRYAPIANEQRITFRVIGEEALTLGDEIVLERVLANVVDNAIQHGNPGGSVTISVAADGRMNMVTVADDGPGIQAHEVPHLFTRFFRGTPARGRASGIGLGLAIAEAGALAHGGLLEYVYTGEGASFQLSLPALPDRIAVGGSLPERHSGREQ